MGKNLTRRAFVAAACGTIAMAAIGGCAKPAEDTTEWTWRQDDDLPVLCMEVSGGAVVAMAGSGWKTQDDWIQLQLSGGSIPGKKIESVTKEEKSLVIRLKDSGSEGETADMMLTEYRLEGGDALGVEQLFIEEHGERYEAQRDSTASNE